MRSCLPAARTSKYISDHVVTDLPSQKSDVAAQPNRLLLEILKVAVGNGPKHLTGANRICLIDHADLGGLYP